MEEIKRRRPPVGGGRGGRSGPEKAGTIKFRAGLGRKARSRGFITGGLDRAEIAKTNIQKRDKEPISSRP